MPSLFDRALHPATGRFRWLIAAIFLSPIAGYISTAIVAVTALLEALRHDKLVRAIRLSRAVRVTATIMLLFFLSIFVSDLIHQRDHHWWSDLKYLLAIGGPLLLVAQLSDIKMRHEDIGRLALISSAITIVVTVSQHLYYAKVLGVPGWRSAALSGNTLFVSAMFVPMLFLTWLGFEKRSHKARWLSAATFVMGVAATAVALGARASLLIILAMTPVLILFVLNRLRVPLRNAFMIVLAVSIAVGVTTILAAIANPSFALRFGALFSMFQNEHFATAANAASGGRIQNWQAAWQAVLAQPLTGYGFRTDAEVIAKYLPKDAVLVTAHQQYLSFGITAGLFGLLAGIAYLALPIINALCTRASEGDGQRLYAGVALAVPIMLNGFTDTIFDDMRIQGFYSVMIMVLLCAHDDAEQPVPKPERPAPAFRRSGRGNA